MYSLWYSGLSSFLTPGHSLNYVHEELCYILLTLLGGLITEVFSILFTVLLQSEAIIVSFACLTFTVD